MSPVPCVSATCPHPQPQGCLCLRRNTEIFSVQDWCEKMNGEFIGKAIHSGHRHANFGLSAFCTLSAQWNFSISTNQNESIERAIWGKTRNATGNKTLPSCKLAPRSWMCPFCAFCSGGTNLNINAFRRFSNRICCTLPRSSLFCLLSSLLWSPASPVGRAWDS